MTPVRFRRQVDPLAIGKDKLQPSMCVVQRAELVVESTDHLHDVITGRRGEVVQRLLTAIGVVSAGLITHTRTTYLLQ